MIAFILVLFEIGTMHELIVATGDKRKSGTQNADTSSLYGDE